MELDFGILESFAEALKQQGKQPATIESYSRDARGFQWGETRTKRGREWHKPAGVSQKRDESEYKDCWSGTRRQCSIAEQRHPADVLRPRLTPQEKETDSFSGGSSDCIDQRLAVLTG